LERWPGKFGQSVPDVWSGLEGERDQETQRKDQATPPSIMPGYADVIEFRYREESAILR